MYTSTATQESDFELGIYAHDSGDDLPGVLIEKTSPTAKGTTAGWKRVTGLNIPIDAETIYWVALQLDDTLSATNTDFILSGGTKVSQHTSGQTTLPSPWGAGSGVDNAMQSIYAVWEPICANGVCKFPSSKATEMIGLREGTATGDRGFQIKWDVSALCDLNPFSIETANLTLYNEAKTGSVNTNIVTYLIRNDSWNEGDNQGSFNNHVEQDSTSGFMSSNTQGTFNNISVLDQIRLHCDYGDSNFSMRFEDPDNPMGSIFSTSVTLPEIGESRFSNENYLRFSTRTEASIAFRPTLYVEYTEDTGAPKVTLSSPEDNTFTTSQSINFKCNITDNFNISNTTLYVYNSSNDIFNNTEIDFTTETSANITFSNIGLDVGGYKWNCLSYDNDTNLAWASSNFSLNITIDNAFIFPTPMHQKTRATEIYFNMSLNETCGTGADALIIELDKVNTSICTGCPPSPPGFRFRNDSTINDGNHTYKMYCNSEVKDVGWTITETGVDNVVEIVSPLNNTLNQSQNFLINCSAYAPSGITNITLWGDFSGKKYEKKVINTTEFSGLETNISIIYNVTVSQNDSYFYHCESKSTVNNTKNSSDNRINIGVGKVYIVFAIDTEAANREAQDTTYNMQLLFSNYNNDNVSDTDRLFNSTWRNLYTDSEGQTPKLTWYMMTHEGHCHAEDLLGNIADVDCNIIAEIMFGNSTFYSDDFYYRNKVIDFGDDYGWHNHHSTWNGSTEAGAGEWIGDTASEFVFNGSQLFYNDALTELDYVRAEKLVSQFAYNNALPWSSFRAGWLVLGPIGSADRAAYIDFLANNTALLFTNFPEDSGNFWEVERGFESHDTVISFPCGPGPLTNDEIKNAFQYAKNGTSVVVCAFGHNYAGSSSKSNIQVIHQNATVFSSEYGVDFEWKTALDASQNFFRINDTISPNITITIAGDNVIADFDETLFMAPAISILITNGTTTNFSLDYMTKVTDFQYTYDKSKFEPNVVGYRVRATDSNFNVNTSGFVESDLNIVSPTNSIPFRINTNSQNITARFTLTSEGGEKTTGVTLDSIKVNGTVCDPVGSLDYISGAWQQECSVNFTLTHGFHNLTVTAKHTTTPFLSDTEEDAIEFIELLTILSPTQANPLGLNFPQNITVNFSMRDISGNFLDADVSVFNITFDGIDCTLQDSAGFAGSNIWQQNCSVPDLVGQYNITVFGNHSDTNEVNKTELNAVSFSSCNYPGSGDWRVNCNDNCVIDAIVSLPNNKLILSGIGSFTILANIIVDRIEKPKGICKVFNKKNDGNALMVRKG